MKAIKGIIKVAKSVGNRSNNQSVIDIYTNNAKYYLEALMLNNEIKNQLEQQYYNRINGCSIKAQKDNLFDYATLAGN